MIDDILAHVITVGDVLTAVVAFVVVWIGLGIVVAWFRNT